MRDKSGKREGNVTEAATCMNRKRLISRTREANARCISAIFMFCFRTCNGQLDRIRTSVQERICSRCAARDPVQIVSQLLSHLSLQGR